MTISRNDVANLTSGHTPVLSPHGTWIGSIGRIYTSDDSGEPSWATVGTGLFGTHETFIPLRDAEFSGHDLRIPYDKHTVKGAPRVHPESHLTPEEEDELYRYYGLERTPATTTAARSQDEATDDRGVDSDRTDDSPAAAPDGGNATGGPEEVTGPGERTTRLRRFVVTERVVQSVEELPDEDKPADDR